MSPVSLPARPGDIRVSLRWAIVMLGGALSFGAATVWQGALAYGRLGTVETEVSRNSGRIDEISRQGERIVRLETTIGIQTDMLKRIEAKLDRR